MARPLPLAKTAIILSGGGARAAYQVGALRAIAHILGRGAHMPFPVICGTSSGAINATLLAINADDFPPRRRAAHPLVAPRDASRTSTTPTWRRWRGTVPDSWPAS